MARKIRFEGWSTFGDSGGPFRKWEFERPVAEIEAKKGWQLYDGPEDGDERLEALNGISSQIAALAAATRANRSNCSIRCPGRRCPMSEQPARAIDNPELALIVALVLDSLMPALDSAILFAGERCSDEVELTLWMNGAVYGAARHT